jgi:hypothetical protein
MLTSDRVHNEINKCKYNKGSIRLDIYPKYMSEYMRYIDEDQQCADMDFIQNIYATQNKNMATHDATNNFIIEGMEKRESVDKMFTFILVAVVIFIFMFISTTFFKCK